jgi:hypothetical protein
MEDSRADCFPKGSLEKVSRKVSPKDSDSEVVGRAEETVEVNAPASDRRLARTTAAADAIIALGSIATTGERRLLPTTLSEGETQPNKARLFGRRYNSKRRDMDTFSVT